MITTLRKVKVVDNYKEHLSEKISILTKQGMYKATTKGQAIGKVIYGYKMSEDKTLLIDEGAADIVKNIYSWTEQGYGLIKIVELLKESGIPTPGEYRKRIENPACVWTASTIFQIIRNKVYTGIYTYNIDGEIIEIEGNHAPIISKEQFQKVQEMLKERVLRKGKVR